MKNGANESERKEWAKRGKSTSFQNFTSEKDAFVGNSKPTFHINPLEEIKKLHDEKIALYERMLKEKDEMMARLEKLLSK